MAAESPLSGDREPELRPAFEGVASKQAFDEVFSAVYEELRRLASVLKRNDGSATLATTDVVNEAYLRLQGSPHIALNERLHFKRIAARAMRRLLVDAARRRSAGKRGGDQVVMVTLGHASGELAYDNDRVLDLHDAIEELKRADARQAEILEMKYFGGLPVAEIAAALNVSETTVARDSRVAEAWLKTRLVKGN